MQEQSQIQIKLDTEAKTKADKLGLKKSSFLRLVNVLIRLYNEGSKSVQYSAFYQVLFISEPN